MQLPYFYSLFFILCSTLLVGCGGSSGENTTPTIGTSLTLSLTNEQGQAVSSINTGQAITLNANARDDFGQPINNLTINFSTTLATLSQPSAITNNNGIASVNLITTASDAGVSTIAVEATIAGTAFSQSQDLQINALADISASLQLFDPSCTTAVTQLTAGQSFCVIGQLIRNNQPIANQSVSFTTSLGNLRTVASLTDTNGQFSTFIDSTVNDVGVGDLTLLVNDLAISSSYEFLSANQNLTLQLLTQDCNTPITTQAAGNSFCVIATLTANGTPVSNQLINIQSSLGDLRAATLLTNANGQATTFIDSDPSIIGAGQIVASFNNVQGIANFSYNQGVQLNLALTILDESCSNEVISVITGTTLCLQAELLSGTTPLSGELINFISGLGALRQNTALTNNSGIAQVLLDTPGGILGATQVTASLNALQANANFELTQVDENTVLLPQIALNLFQDGQATNRIQAGENLQLQVLMTDAQGQPLSDQIITFTAEIGILATTTALTNNTGIAAVTLTTLNTDLGAGVVTASIALDNLIFSDNRNYEVLSPDAVDQEAILIGSFNESGQFIEGVIGVTSALENADTASLSAGGTLGLTVALVNQDNERLITPTPITFTSTCFSNGFANLDEQVTTINGEAQATFEDINCATAAGNNDTIVATVVANSINLTATRLIRLLPEAIGSIEFISAEPTSIVLQGTGGQGNQETSTLTFSVRGSLGNPLAQQLVSFNLDSDVGGLTIDPTESLTNSEGLVTTRVTSGNVPTAVRVRATINTSEGDIATQSDLLSVNTGLPDQNSMTITTSTFNPEANNISGGTETITVFLSDSFNNPVPDGTTVNFTTEGASIQPSCNTSNGRCSVVWTATEPRAADHRITILATAIGHETFFDTNGNNIFDDADGVAINDNSDSGIFRSSFASSGFIDISEAWRDDNENTIFDSGEPFIDFNNNQIYDDANGVFDAPQCTHSSLCPAGDNPQSTINIRKALVMVMSSSEARVSLLASDIPSNQNNPDYIEGKFVIFTNDNNNITADGFLGNDVTIQLAEEEAINLDFTVADTAAGLGQILPNGTDINIISTIGNVSGALNTSIPNTTNTRNPDNYGGNLISFRLVNTNSLNVPNEQTLNGSIIITFNYPSGIVQTLSFTIRLLGQ